MLKNLLRAAFIISWFCIVSCGYTHYYIVRHAEKADPMADDPSLSDSGFERARTLSDTLAGKQINRIYVSDKIRTQQTAQPTAERFGLQPVIIPKPETNQLITQL